MKFFIKNWSKYNWNNSSKLAYAIQKQINAVKKPEFKKELIRLYQERDTLSIPYKTSLDTPYSNSNSISNNIISYGEYNRIILSKEEYTKLEEEYTKEVLDSQIAKLDEYIQSNDNKYGYTNFDLVIRRSFKENWFKGKSSYLNTKTQPSWLEKEIQHKEASLEEQEKIKNILKEFKKEGN
jgi:hypothetical protein